MSPGTVLQVVQPPDGGVAEHVVQLSLGLAGRGWRVVVVTGTDSTVTGRLRRAGIEVRELVLSRGPHRDDLAAARRLRAIDRAVAPQVVHAHSSKAGVLVRAALPGASRLVYTPHCPAFLSGLGAPERMLSLAFEQAAVPRSGAVVAVCDWERRALVRRLRGARGRTVLVPNGVGAASAGAPDARLAAFARGRPLAGLVAVLRLQKNPLALVRAAASLAEGAGCAAIVGDGALAGAVDAEIARLGVGDRVARFSYGGSMEPHLAALDLFVLPSRWEAFPIALLEAMRAGLPVLATRVGGVGEAVTDGVTGRLVAPGDGDGLARALGGLLADAPGRARMGAAARLAVAQRYSLAAMVDGVERVYTGRISAAASRGGGRRATS